jgi:hypothetical protein
MRRSAVPVLLLLVAAVASAAGQPSGAPRGPARSVKFATGETVIESDGATDHVVVKDAQGEVVSESWCDAGAFDAYFALFTEVKEALAHGDRGAVVKLVAYPFRVNGEKPLIFRSEAALSKSYHKVFTSQVLDQIRRAEPAAVFCRDGEGMVGDGVLWASVTARGAAATVLNP